LEEFVPHSYIADCTFPSQTWELVLAVREGPPAGYRSSPESQLELEESQSVRGWKGPLWVI